MVPNKAIVPVAIAISLFFVLICGAVAMIAAAPHMAVPQAVKMPSFWSTFNSLLNA